MKPYYADDRATLYRADALAVLADLPAASVDALITDPPFKISQEYGPNVDADNLVAVSAIWGVAQHARRVVKPGGSLVMFYDARILPVAIEAMRSAGWRYLRGLTFYRRWGGAFMFNGWMSTSDFILVYANPGARVQFYGKASHDVYIRTGPEPESTGHPAQKPLDPLRNIAQRVCPPGGTILDPFAGSGTTGVAALAEGRKFIGVELTEHYAEVAATRLRAAARDDGSDDAAEGDGPLGLFTAEGIA